MGISSAALIGNASNQSRIINCHVDGNNFEIIMYEKEKANVLALSHMGGLVGEVNNELSVAASEMVNFENCSVTNIAISANRSTGGFAGSIYNANLEGCYADKTIVNTVTIGGGFAGLIFNNSTMKRCYSISTKSTGTKTFSYCGGFSAMIGNGSSAVDCYAIDPQVKMTGYAGGFSGIIKKGTVTNCYSAGGKIISYDIYCGGGFVGLAIENSIITNCYAQTDVESRGGQAGGFVGRLGDPKGSEPVTIINCYAAGVIKGIDRVGGFVGWLADSQAKINNCYAAGSVSGQKDFAGFIGYCKNISVNNIFSSCFYDTTTTGMTTAFSDGTTNDQIIGISTTNAIDYEYVSDYFTSWDIKQNLLGAAGGSGDSSSPWYMDDDLTYPYFYYQYDGHNNEDTNYSLIYVKYQDGLDLGQNNCDFKIKDTGTPTPLKVRSGGAAKAYFPYSETSRYDINQSADVNVPITAVRYDKLYSLGSVSRTNIIAFANLPYAVKTSNRPDSMDKGEKTWVGDIITYTIKVYTSSTAAAWEEVVLEDALPEGVTLVEGTLKFNATYIYEAPAQDKPYYTCEYNSKNQQLLKIYLPDFEKSANVTTEHIKIEFDALVGKAAATDFRSEGWQAADNIRNTGTVSGILVYPNERHEVRMSFDDENTNPVYDSAVFVKTDAETGERLGGAKFTLYQGTASAGTEYITNSAGIMYLKLTDGDYKLKEEGAYSFNYEEPPDAWYFTVTDGLITDISTAAASGESSPVMDITEVAAADSTGIYYIIKNVKKVGSITIIKQNDAGTKLSGAEFLLEMWVEDEANPDGHYVTSASLSTGDTGTLVFENLKQAQYRITEVVPPGEEYSLLKDAIEVSIPSDNQFDLTYTITDAFVYKLPETGGIPVRLMLYCAGGFMILAAVGLFMRRGKC